jgi:hypothetical protein
MQWLMLALRHRSLTLPSAANPAITAGGLIGEGKLEYFSAMGSLARATTAPYSAVSTHRRPSVTELWQLMADAGLSFPIVAKPDLSLCGYGVRLLANLGALKNYLAAFPRNEVVVLQQYLPQEGEAGIFYVRDPVTRQGSIIGLGLRYYPRVIGDGHSTISQLVAADPRLRRRQASRHHQCCIPDNHVPEAGEVVRLATIGATRVGGLYRDGSAYITPALTSAIDAIARDMPEFHCGRFDVRFDTLQELQAGSGFIVMEVNGAGAEAIQAWDPDISLFSAFKLIFARQRLLFAIGAEQRRKGARAIGILALMRLFYRQRKLISRYPPSN